MFDTEKTLIKIYHNFFKRKRFIRALNKTLAEHNETLVVKPKDVYVFNIFIQRGYLSGVNYNFYFRRGKGYKFDVFQRHLGN